MEFQLLRLLSKSDQSMGSNRRDLVFRKRKTETSPSNGLMRRGVSWEKPACSSNLNVPRGNLRISRNFFDRAYSERVGDFPSFSISGNTTIALVGLSDALVLHRLSMIRQAIEVPCRSHTDAGGLNKRLIPSRFCSSGRAPAPSQISDGKHESQIGNLDLWRASVKTST